MRNSAGVGTGTLAAVQGYAVLPVAASVIWIPEAGHALSVSDVTASELATALLLSVALGTLLLAPRLVNRSAREVLFYASFGMMLANILTALPSPSAVAFLALRIVDGLFAGICVGFTSILAAETTTPVRTFGLLQLAQAAIGIAMFLLAGVLTANLGFSGVFYLIAGGWLLVLPPILALPKGRPIRAKTKALHVPAGLSGKIFMGFVAVVLLYMTYNGVFASAGYLAMHLGITLTAMTPMLALASAFCAVGSITGALCTSPRVEKAVLLTGGLGEAISLTTAGFGSGWWALTLSLCGVMFFLFAMSPVLFAIISRLDASGHAASGVQAAALVGIALGPVFSATVTRMLSLSAMTTIAGMGASAGLLIALCLAFRTGREHDCRGSSRSEAA